MSNRNSMLVGLFFLAIALSLYAFFVKNFFPYTIDDAFITFRYSANLASGHGPTWNPHRAPIEGYTSWLWMMIMTLPHLAGADAVHFAKGFGIVMMSLAFLSVMIFVLTATRDSDGRPDWFSAGAAALFFAGTPFSAIHSIAGMETPMFSLLLSAFCFLTYLLLRNPTRRMIVMTALCALLLGLTRPEGNLAAAVGLIASFFFLPRDKRLFFLLASMDLYILPGAGYFIWRALFYGHLFPLPFYIKVTNPSELLAGQENVINFLKYIGFVLCPFIALGLLRARKTMAPAIAATICLPIFFLFPEHLMGFDHRFLFPLTPFLCVLSGNGIGLVRQWVLSDEPGKPQAVRMTALMAIVLVATAALTAPWRGALFMHTNYAGGLEKAHVALGKELASAVLKGKKLPVLAVEDAGATPYYSGWHVIDVYGLNNPVVALQHTYEPAKIFDRKPDIIVLVSEKPGSFKSKRIWQKNLHKYCEKKKFTLLKTYQWKPRYNLLVMGSREIPVIKWLNWFNEENQQKPGM